MCIRVGQSASILASFIHVRVAGALQEGEGSRARSIENGMNTMCATGTNQTQEFQ